MPNLRNQSTDTLLYVNKVIDSFFSERIKEAELISPFYAQLWSDIARLIHAGGKRVRPKMTVLAYEAFGGKDSKVIYPVAASQEFLHLSLLIHDDIIDRDSVRYGVDNIAGAYEKNYYAHVEDSADRGHYAQSAALLAGDLLISSSYRLLSESRVAPELLSKVLAIHSQSIFEVAGGELIDTESAFRPLGSIDSHTVALYKTASYTFVAPLLIGATLAGVSQQTIQSLIVFANNLGTAYQLRDDVIGVFGDESQIGKTTIGDIREGKHTYLVEQFYALASTEEKVHFELYFGDQHVQKNEVESIKKLFVSTGALARVELAITHYADAAQEAARAFNVDDVYRAEFEQLVTAVTKRDK